MKPKNLYPWGFLALPEKLSRYETAKAVVLPIPYDATVSYGAGTRNGPSAMIAASRQSETYDPEFGGDPSTVGIATLGELEQVASGPAEMMNRVESTAKQILRDGKFLMSLGGEHSISYGLIKAHKKKYSDLTVLHFDAHTDLRTEYQGSPYSHASIMSHVWELCDFVSVGIRSFCGSDVEKRADSEGRLIRPADLRKNCDFTSIILSMLSDHVYITFDLDGFDPAVMPSVGTPEPGGLLWDETLALIRATGESKQIVGADVVELAPISGLLYPDFAAARLAYKIISNALWSK
jgi:agmatinase